MTYEPCWGKIRCDDKEAGLVTFIDGKSGIVALEHTGGPVVFIEKDRAIDFELSAKTFGWKFEHIGYDAVLKRNTYTVEPAKTTALDFNGGNGRNSDAALVRNHVRTRKKRWRGVTEAVKDEVVRGLVMSGNAALNRLEDPDEGLSAAGVYSNIARTIATIEGQNQADEHMDEKNDRLDAGLPTEAIKLFALTQDEADKV